MTRSQAAFCGGVSVLLVMLAALVPAQQRAFVHSHGWLHPWFHIVIFGVVAYLCGCSVRSAPARVALLVAVALFGCFTEFAESYVYGGPLEFEDMATDAIGTILGSGFAAVLRWRFSVEAAPESAASTWE